MHASKILPDRRKLRPELSVRWRGALMISIPVTCLFASIFAIAGLRSKTLATLEQEQQSQQTLLKTNRLLMALVNAETGVRGYLITRRPEFLEPYSQGKTILPELLDSVHTKVLSNPAQQQQFQEIPSLAQQQIRLLEQILKTSDAEEATTLRATLLTDELLKSKLIMDDLRQKIAEFSKQEERLQRARKAEVVWWRRLTSVVQWGALAVGLLGSGAAWYLFKQLDRELAEQASRLRESNIYLLSVFDNVVDGIIILNDRGYIQSANAAAVKIFGYEPEEFIGKHLQRLIAETFTDDSGKVMNSLVGKNQDKLRLQQETLGRHKEGKTFPMEFAFSEMRLDNKHLYILIVRDITERKQSQEALRSRAEELARMTRVLAQTTVNLEKRNAELDQFAYIVSHDLKAPLRAIANLSQWIEEDLEDKLTEETRHQMDLMRSRVYRMEALINAVLEYSRVGRLRTELEAVDVEALLAEVIDSLAPPPGFTVKVMPGMPTLITERLLLEQVFANLISNAIKHNHRPNGKIVISWEDKTDFYEFAVADDGPGIAPEFHEKVFVIFQTLEPRDKVENTGVGLAIVKKIIEDKGGTIYLESKLDQGTIFRFTWFKNRKAEGLEDNLLALQLARPANTDQG
jgi:PAS domain S-box-containing protein